MFKTVKITNILNFTGLQCAGFPLVQTKIVDFFRIQRSSQSSEKPSQGSQGKRVFQNLNGYSFSHIIFQLVMHAYLISILIFLIKYR